MSSLLGQQLNNYLLIKELGRGTWGSVYLAKHFLLENKPQVAIKILHASLRSSTERNRFFQEAYLLDKLSHPHILPVYDAGQHNDLPFLIVAYASGGSLRDRLDAHPQQPLELKEAIRVTSQIGQALQYAHDQNIVHRDLKPENILFNTNSDALLADFGIAMELRRTNIVHEIGTPPYMAPEQFMGKMSKRSDQYALACIAYEMLTGHVPFNANDIYTMGYRHIHEQPTAPSKYNSKIPPAVEWTILKAMSKQREQRYPNITAFLEALQQGLPGERPTNTIPSMMRLPARAASSDANPSEPVVAEISPVIEQPAIAKAVEQLKPLTPVTPPQIPQVRPLSPPRLVSRRESWSIATGGFIRATPTIVDGTVYVGSWDHSLYALDASNGTQRWSVATGGTISSSARVADGLVYVGSFDHKLHAFDTTSGTVRWSATTANFISATPTLAQGLVYVGSWDYMLYAFDAETGAPRWSSATSDAISSSSVAARGMIYTGSRDGRLYAFNATTGAQVWNFPTNDIISGSPTLVDRTVYVGSWDRRLYALDAVTGKKRWSVATHGAIGSTPTVVYGVVFVGSDAHMLYAFDASSGQMLWSARTGGAITGSPVVHNGVVYAGSEDGRLYAFNTANGAVLWTFATQGAISSSPVITNGLLYVGSDDGRLYALYLQEPTK